MTDTATLIWFRQDLRLQDNPALVYATDRGSILPVYIVDDRNPGRWRPGAASRWWLHHSLTALNQRLNGQLRRFRGDPLALLPRLLETTGIRRIVWNRGYEPWQIARDAALKALLEQRGIEVVSFNGSLLWEPWDVAKKDGTPYKVFTPFYRRGCLAQPAPRYPLAAPKTIRFFKAALESPPLQSLGLLSATPWYHSLAPHWTPGEAGAGDSLSRFAQDALARYQDERNRPDRPGTSRLSPHLHFGELSPNQVWYVIQNAPLAAQGESSRDGFLSELGWREFAHYLLYHWPTLPTENFQAKFDRFRWRDDPKALKAWQQGQTGIPIIDAGMRELWQTGYMHNRVRMIVGSFLVKNLLIHWQQGENWFWDTLLDADLASNSASWQWVAGSGADAAPYFRIFNPVTQGLKFDPEGLYVKRYCPELAHLPIKYLHSPWTAPTEVLETAALRLGQSYPAPIVDLKATRARALSAFSALKVDS